MTKVEFGKLEDLAPRDAWSHEAKDFTPWLAANIDQIAEAIGVPLELTGQEVAVESFSADILARNPADDTIVLIENQLEQTDHTHLGQIMTYLAGLDAHTVIWVAPYFREPHLSAIRWLNAHTNEGFAFFAIRLRVVKIGDSPYAPVFEVIEQPDRWVKHLKAHSDPSDLQAWRKDYWERLQREVPELTLDPRGQLRYVPLGSEGSLHAVLEMHRTRAVILVRSDATQSPEELRNEIFAVAPRVEAVLAPIKETRYGGALYQSQGADLSRPETWDDTIAWHAERLRSYVKAFAAKEGTAG